MRKATRQSTRSKGRVFDYDEYDNYGNPALIVANGPS
jgi:hypothetical protein